MRTRPHRRRINRAEKIEIKNRNPAVRDTVLNNDSGTRSLKLFLFFYLQNSAAVLSIE